MLKVRNAEILIENFQEYISPPCDSKLSALTLTGNPL